MDNQLSKLDPKLQETFNRVMNTPVPAPTVKTLVQTPSSGMPTVAAPPPSAVPPAPIISPAPVQPQHETSAEENPVDETTKSDPQKVVVVPSQEAQVNSANSQVFSSKKKAGKVSPVIVVLGMTIFFLVYTLIWVKVFNIKLPFLP